MNKKQIRFLWLGVFVAIFGLTILAIGMLFAEMGGPQWMRWATVWTVGTCGLGAVCLIGAAAIPWKIAEVAKAGMTLTLVALMALLGGAKASAQVVANPDQVQVMEVSVDGPQDSPIHVAVGMFATVVGLVFIFGIWYFCDTYLGTPIPPAPPAPPADPQGYWEFCDQVPCVFVITNAFGTNLFQPIRMTNDAPSVSGYFPATGWDTTADIGAPSCGDEVQYVTLTSTTTSGTTISMAPNSGTMSAGTADEQSARLERLAGWKSSIPPAPGSVLDLDPVSRTITALTGVSLPVNHFRLETATSLNGPWTRVVDINTTATSVVATNLPIRRVGDRFFRITKP